MLITKSDYTTLYGDIDDTLFNRLEYDAEMIVKDITTGADGICKVTEYFPTDTNAEALKRAIAKVVNILVNDELKNQIVVTDNGVRSNIVNSMSSGSESMSFDNSGMKETTLDIKSTAIGLLKGIKDKNGVNILYMGEYPNV